MGYIRMKRNLIRILGPFIALVFFAAALWVIHNELKAHSFHEIVLHMQEIPSSRILLALAMTLLNYLIMTGYDFLALRYIRHPFSYGKTALASFIGYAFANNLGFAMITGASIRYRLYSAWGFSLMEITRIIVFCTLTLWLGFFSLGGVVFLLEPLRVPQLLHLPISSVRPLGMIFILCLAAYLALSVLRKKPFTIGKWEFVLPSLGLFVPQILIAMFDWVLAAGVLFFLLPESMALSFPAFLAVFLLAQVAGIASQVPGGLGVFEAVIIILISPALHDASPLGALLIYRGMYYVFPLVSAASLLAAHEFYRKKQDLFKGAAIIHQGISLIVPRIFTVTTFTAGAILLFSGSTPAVPARIVWLRDFLPLPVMEVSHFFGSIAGVGLLFLARGLQRRIDAAYIFTCLVLGAGIVFSLLKGLDYEEAAILSLMLMALLPCRSYFYRKASLFTQSFSPRWYAAIITALLVSLWLVFFTHIHVEYSDELWWRFAFMETAPRSLRALVGAGVCTLWFFAARLLRPVAEKPVSSSRESIVKAHAIVKASRSTYANLALLGDKSFMFNDEETAFIMYGIEGRSWIAMGDPVGPQNQGRELIWQFREMCDRSGGWPVFYEVGAENISLYLELGLDLIKLGEEARVPLRDFSLEGGSRKELRQTFNKLAKQGCRFEMVQPEGVPALLPELKVISNAWLHEKNTGEKGFSLGSFQEDYLKQFPMALVRREGRIIAFANIWTSGEYEELSVDLMRYLPESPHGVMEYLFIQLMLWGKQAGYQWFGLGMAPLSGLEDRWLAPMWNKVASFIFTHGEHFYNFQGLRHYKNKFDPVWSARYLASPGTFILPVIVTNIAALTSGGIKGIFVK